ncbi:Hypothetical predicted protein [Pelobates cultripes]|uniref:Uncharacterized protein n=1 Tax=Pelobates cultripes TaxID=61616 RepID=A0AAD1WM03_PELCU|nr:Hypothetical predicted protein [Pelobates cultripes]
MSSMNCYMSQNCEKEDSGNDSQPIYQVLQPKQRKLVLHLDLNNTILVSDAVTGQGPTAALNSYLSTVTWGKLSDTGEWQWLNDCLSVTPPSKDAINYYTKFGRSTDFVDTELGRRFKEVHNHHMKLLEWKGEHDKVFTQVGEDRKAYNWILPSFFYLIEKLHQQGRQFTIILRTFGTDLPLVLQAVHSAFTGKHPHFPQLQNIPMTVDLTPGKIRCSKRVSVLTRGSDRISTKANEGVIYDYFSTMTGIGGFQDHFEWWARNSFTGVGGKPFWINPSDCDAQHIIIDDNIRLNEEDTIVNCRMLLSKENGQEYRAVPTSEVYDVCLVQTDLLRAIAEEGYFLDCVRKCEENYEHYLSTLQDE